MKIVIQFTVLSLAFLLSGCATPGKATLLGAGVGLAAGTGAGLMSYGGRNGQFTARNVIVGGALGGLLGAGVGYIAHELVEKGEKDAFDKGKEAGGKSPTGNGMSSSFGKPVLIPAKVESRFVDDSVRGSIFVPAHVEYIIVEPARWSR